MLLNAKLVQENMELAKQQRIIHQILNSSTVIEFFFYPSAFFLVAIEQIVARVTTVLNVPVVPQSHTPAMQYYPPSVRGNSKRVKNSFSPKLPSYV